ncbi:MAG TPA: DUF2993 domain-containing protein [Jatrophihabitans sp.]|jgi:hypothetical protein|nr:DUF2993 domain-containing protein [Jatrophihabitans sp.]
MVATGSRGLRGLVIGLVVLVLLLIAADRVGVYIAERTAGDTIQSSQDLNSRPAVAIAGFPFLTQLAAGDFGEITVTAKDVPVGQAGHPLDISTVRVVLRHVTVARDFSSVRAATANAVATISYAELGATLGIDVSYAGAGRIKAAKSVTVAGQTVAASVTAEPTLTNGALSFVATQVNGAGQLGAVASAALNQVFDLAVPLQGIPFKVRVQSLRTDPSGVTIDLTGRDLSYSN